jgi:hypothetical protein
MEADAKARRAGELLVSDINEHRETGPVKRRPTLAYVIRTNDSGSTLLAFVLDSHPMICALGEPPKRSIRKRGQSFVCSCGSPIGECDFWRGLFATLNAHGLPFSERDWPNDYRYFNDFINRVLAKHQTGALSGLQRAVSAVFPGHGRKMRMASQASAQFVHAALAQTGKQVFLDTSKQLFRFEQLRRIDEWQLKVIRLVRDVRWFAYTKRKHLRPGEAARQWRAAQLARNRYLAGFPPEDLLVVRYEDLCRQTAPAARRIHAFLGVTECDPPTTYDPANHHIIGDGISGPFTVSTAEPWRTALSAADLDLVLQVAGDVNQTFGYAP